MWPNSQKKLTRNGHFSSTNITALNSCRKKIQIALDAACFLLEGLIL